MALQFGRSVDMEMEEGGVGSFSHYRKHATLFLLILGLFFGIRFAAAITSDGATSTRAAAPRNLELHIANNGLVLLRGARIQSIDKDSISVAVDFGSLAFTWRVKMNNARILDKKGEETTDALAVGDLVTVTGSLGTKGSQPIIEGQYVRLTSVEQ